MRHLADLPGALAHHGRCRREPNAVVLPCRERLRTLQRRVYDVGVHPRRRVARAHTLTR